MSKKTRYHRHGGEIHIAVTEEGKLTEHVCIGKIDENRPDYQEHTKLIILACNSHADLLKACKALMNDMSTMIQLVQNGHSLDSFNNDSYTQGAAAIAKAKEN